MKPSATLRFDHVAVPVHDAMSAYRLFSDTLGLPLIAAYTGDDWDGAPWLMMIFALATSGRAALAAWQRRLEAAGFAIRHEDHGDQQSIYFEDASGRTREITTARKGSAADPGARATVDQWLAQYRRP